MKTGDDSAVTLRSVNFTLNDAAEAQGGAVFCHGPFHAESVVAVGNRARSHGAVPLAHGCAVLQRPPALNAAGWRGAMR